MNALSLAVDTIKTSVSALDVADALGWEVRHGRCKCPIHGGNDFNCRLYPGDRGYMCWVCKSAGDVISLVRNYNHNMSFKDTVSWFNSTFNLGMNIDSPPDPKAVKQAEIARKQRERERQEKEQMDRMQYDQALAVDRIVQALEEQRDLYAPKTPDEPWNPVFCTAVRLLPGAKRFAEKCWYECMEVKK